MSLNAEVGSLFLDFDGMICDSLEECYRSSWLAAEGLIVDETPPPDPPFDASYRARFNACRPFVRSGEDYLVAHQWAALGRVPSSQADFDLSLTDIGTDALQRKKARLYDVRESLLRFHRSLWLSWNPLYPGMAEALSSQAENHSVWILSTKKAEFIVEILRQAGIAWPLAQTLYTGTRKKLAMIDELCHSQLSVLIDDQVDHLDFSHPHCQCFLAVWGYADPRSKATAERTITLEQTCDLIRVFPRIPHPNGSEATIPRP